MTPASTNAADDRDAWLDDVRRWYYGGNAPATDGLPLAATGGSSSAEVASSAIAARRCCDTCRQVMEAAAAPVKAAGPAAH